MTNIRNKIVSIGMAIAFLSLSSSARHNSMYFGARPHKD